MKANLDGNRRIHEIARALGDDLEHHPRPSGSPLPSIRSLSRAYEASPATVQGALRILCGKGVLRKSGKERFRYYQKEPAPPPAIPACNRREELEAQLKSDLLTGRFSPELPLPTNKELIRRYRCGSGIIRTVLGSLIRKGLITREGRKYYVSRSTGGHGQAPICIVSDAHHLLSANELFWRLISVIEQETIHLNWPLAHAILRKWNLPPDAAAFICLSGKEDLLLRLKREFPRVPLVMIDPSDSLQSSPAISGKNRRILRIYNDHFAAGLQVASRLANLGHRRVAVIGPFSPEDRWVYLRGRGIAEIFPIGGESDCEYSSKFLVENTDNVPVPPEAEQIEKHAWALRRSLKLASSIPWRMQYFTANTTYSIESMLRNATGIQKLLDAALADKKVSAWICLNDEAAAVAIHYLERKRIKPGEDISVFGFDNSHLAYTMGISSYDFNFMAAGHVAVRWLERPSALARARNGEYVVKGYVVERASTGALSGR